MRSASCSRKLACILFVFLSFLAGHAQGPTGAVSSTVTKPAAASAENPPASNDSKPLPWKLLASPMGALNDPKVEAAIKALGTCSDPNVPEVQTILTATVGDSIAKMRAQNKAQYLV